MHSKDIPVSVNEERRKVTNFEEYFNGQFRETPVYVPILNGKCSDSPDEMLITTVGTGIAVCLNDRGIKMGGLAHLIIPHVMKDDPDGLRDRFEGVLDGMINTLIRSGSKPEQMKTKIFGGGQLSETQTGDTGAEIVALVKDLLSDRGVQISMEDTGSNAGRRIHFFPTSGKAVRRLLQRQMDRDVLMEREEAFNERFVL